MVVGGWWLVVGGWRLVARGSLLVVRGASVTETMTRCGRRRVPRCDVIAMVPCARNRDTREIQMSRAYVTRCLVMCFHRL